MKWANILYTGLETINMGDVLFPLTIQHLYDVMGVAEQDVVRINYNDLGSYSGEPVLLPICSAFTGYHDGKHITCYSPLITPIFLSLNIIATKLGEEDIAYLKRYAPIGCRDRHTYGVMLKYNIPAYLNGCLSVTMKFHEKEERKTSHVLWVDVPDKLETYIPEEYKKNRLIYSQMRKVEEKNLVEEMVYDAYLQYIRDAKLIITARLHCAIPCIMAGIPVIFAGRAFEYRFAWLENYIRFYSEEEYPEIDWNPGVNMSLCEVRDEMTQFAISRLQYYRSFFDYSSVMERQMTKKTREYKLDVFEKFITAIEKIICENKKECSIAIWGVGQIADMTYDFVFEKYERCSFAGMFDKHIRGEFRGTKIKYPSELFAMKCDLLIIMPTTIFGDVRNRIANDVKDCCGNYVFFTDYHIDREDM